MNREKPELLFAQLEEQLTQLFLKVTPETDSRLPSIRQLAEQLGLHRKTVARAYADLLEDHIIEQKSAKIYQVAASLPRKQLAPFSNIGIIVPQRFSSLFELSSGRPIYYLKGVIDAAAAKNISTIMIQLPDFKASNAEIDRFIGELAKRLIGVIHIGGRGVFPDPPLERLMKYEKLPQVMISAHSHFPNVGTVLWDPAPAVQVLVDRLRSLHHQEIGFVLWTNSFDDYGPDTYFFYSAFQQPSLIRSMLEEYGFFCRDEYHCYKATTYGAVYRALAAKVKNNTLPTVYWCHNDDCANLVLRVLHDLGIRVPEDVSVIGSDALPELSDHDELTTISLPFYSIGFQALNTLLDYFENGKNEQNSVVKVPASLLIKKTLSRAREQLDGAYLKDSNPAAVYREAEQKPLYLKRSLHHEQKDEEKFQFRQSAEFFGWNPAGKPHQP